MSGQPAHWRSTPDLRAELGIPEGDDRRLAANHPHRGEPYEASCLAWEMLTDEDIYGKPAVERAS